MSGSRFGRIVGRRLARAGFSEEEDVMSPRCRDFHCCDSLWLSTYIRHVERRLRIHRANDLARSHSSAERSFERLSPTPGDQIGQVRKADNFDTGNKVCFAGA